MAILSIEQAAVNRDKLEVETSLNNVKGRIETLRQRISRATDAVQIDELTQQEVVLMAEAAKQTMTLTQLQDRIAAFH